MLSTCSKVTLSGQILCSFCLIIGIYISWKGLSAIYHKTIGMTLFLKFLFISSTIAYFLCVTCALCSISLLCHSTSLYNIMFRGSVFSYYCLLLPLLLITFTARVHLTFNNSIYQITPYVLKTFYATIIVIIICNLTYFYISIDFYALSQNSDLYTIGLRLILCSLALYFMLAFILVAIFLQKLNQLIIAGAQRSSIIEFGDGYGGNDECNGLSPQQLELISCVAKYLVISICAFSTTFVMICSVLILSPRMQQSFLAVTIVRTVTLFDIVCNFVCLYLQFSVGSVDYYLMCGICDRRCKKRLNEKTKEIVRIKNHIEMTHGRPI